ncbi:MAG: GDSL-type esterase/lipase family protein [Chloroflexota bacterium]|nr:GDSL-type esterase/lipase family protein [Chloroflexota bacterium]
MTAQISRKISVSLALVVFGILFALLLLEIGVRVWFSARGSEQDRVRYLYSREEIDSQTAQLVGAPYLNYTLNPAAEDVNVRGVRGEMVAIPKPDNVFRIITLGGSTTYGHGLTVDEAYPTQLQRILREEYGYTSVEVVNLGVPGYASLDSLVQLATRGLAHEPDLILVYDGLNDAVVRMFQDPACYNGDSPLTGMGLDRGIWQYASEDLPASTLYRFVAINAGWMADPAIFTYRLDKTGYCPPEPGNISPLDLLTANPPVYLERNLRSMAAMGIAAGARVVFSTFAWDSAAAEAQLAADSSLTQARAMLTAIEEQNALMRTLAGELGVPLVDLAVTMGEGAWYQGDQVHMNADGTRRQAAIYAAALDTLGWVER